MVGRLKSWARKNLWASRLSLVDGRTKRSVTLSNGMLSVLSITVRFSVSSRFRNSIRCNVVLLLCLVVRVVKLAEFTCKKFTV